MNKKCANCEKYKGNGHNYCRMCGYHLTKGFVQHVKIAVVYHVNEKYCGHCGKKHDQCDC